MSQKFGLKVFSVVAAVAVALSVSAEEQKSDLLTGTSAYSTSYGHGVSTLGIVGTGASNKGIVGTGASNKGIVGTGASNKGIVGTGASNKGIVGTGARAN